MCSSDLAAPDGHATDELAVPGREVIRRCAQLAVGQLGRGQPVTYIGRQHTKSYATITDTTLTAPADLLHPAQDGYHDTAAPAPASNDMWTLPQPL